MDSSGNGWYRNDSFTVIGLTLMLTAAFVFFRKSLLEIKILGTCNHMKREKQNAFLFSIFKRIQRWKYETKSCFGRYFLIWIRYFYILLLVIGWRPVHIILRLALTIRRLKHYKRKKSNVGKRSSRI